MEGEGADLVRLIMFGGAILFIGVLAIREFRIKARRERARQEILEYWAEEMPGEMLSNCPMCKFPYPVTLDTCPFCDRSRRRARMLRRDSDWRKETRAGRFHY
ncbi:MAG: hypothetical protein ACYS99_18115 [Planctomycetota bacterium]|jgi:hypothetical protein